MANRIRILKTRGTNPKHSNSISEHEESIALALEATSNRFNLVQQRLQKFQKKKKHANLRNRKHEWIEKFRDLEREESKISKQFDDISSSPHFLKATSITARDKHSIEGKGQPRISIRKFCTEINSILSDPNARELLLAKTKNVKDRYNQIVDELKINRREEADEQLQGSGNVFNDAKVKPSKTTNKIPTEVLDLVNAIKNEFLRIGLESKEITSTLETKLSQVISDLLASLSKPIVDRKSNSEQNSSNTSLTLWDEDSRLVLRNSMKQYQKANMNEKHRVLQSISRQVRRSASATKAELDRLMDEKHVRLKNKEKRQTASATRSQAIRTAIDQIQSIRSSIIDDIAGGLYSIVYDEIAEERSQRLKLLANEKYIGDEKSRDEELRHQAMERHEYDRSTAKRRGEILAAKVKATEYLKTKKEDYRMTQMLELMEQNDEEEARLARLVANRERVDFRRQEQMKKDIQNKDRNERSYQAELERKEKLRAIASSVPYYSTIQNIKSDLLRSTVSRMNDFYEPSSESGLTISQQGLSKLTGFTNDKVFSCPKFRLAHQLHERGVASTAYSCAVVERLIPREDKPF